MCLWKWWKWGKTNEEQLPKKPDSRIVNPTWIIRDIIVNLITAPEHLDLHRSSRQTAFVAVQRIREDQLITARKH